MNTMVLTKDINPNDHKAQRFTMRLAVVSISMMFAGLTSYYIVRQAKGDWAYFEMPTIFWISTLLIGMSSMALHLAHVANRRNNRMLLHIGLLLTFLLGASFCVAQWLGWQELLGQGVFLSGGNTSGSIFYVITGGHAAHVLGGLAFVLMALARTVYLYTIKNNTNTFLNEENDKLRIRTDLISVYWHFMGVLWLYLFIFLYVNH